MRRLLRRSVAILGSFVLASGACRRRTFAVPSQVMVAVDNGVSLEVIDWGGSGRPVVLLAGLGGTAHTFDGFAPKLIPRYHVYGITRRGFGRSSAPASGYSADRLGDDILAVIEFLKLDRPVLVGHSIAGEELSSVASRHPKKVSGLVYLDAAYGYAYYDPARGDFTIDLNDLIQKLADLQPWKGLQDPKLIRELLEQKLPQFENELRQVQSYMDAIPPGSVGQVPRQLPAAVSAIIAGAQKYSSLPVPILAMFADPHDAGLDVSSETRAALEQQDALMTEAQVRAFEKGVPSAHVVRLPHASHNIFVSNEADVLREMDLFIGTLR